MLEEGTCWHCRLEKQNEKKTKKGGGSIYMLVNSRSQHIKGKLLAIKLLHSHQCNYFSIFAYGVV